jgi:branched-chain amino acid transport system permease protein
VRFLFKTDYAQDLRLFKDGWQAFWYGALGLAALAAPLVVDEYLLSQLSFVCIYAIAGTGLMLLSGFTGQISLGHAAFLATGAYTEAVLLQHGVPFYLSLPAAALTAGALGVVVGLPALRLAGIYLAIATLAFAFIVEEIVARWDTVTGGNNGLPVEALEIAGLEFDPSGTEPWRYYYLVLATLVVLMLAAVNLMRSPTGRAFIAIRDSEIAAQSMGVHLAPYKTLAFAISAAYTGVAGAFLAHQLVYLYPESFTILVSIELLLLVVVGGLGSLHGAVFGAFFIIVLPQAIVITKEFFRDDLAGGLDLIGLGPAAGAVRYVAGQPGLDTFIFGLILIGFMLFEPLGLYGRWVKIKLYFGLFPLHKKATFKRQKSYLRTERLR